jgi:hypothetical protein
MTPGMSSVSVTVIRGRHHFLCHIHRCRSFQYSRGACSSTATSSPDGAPPPATIGVPDASKRTGQAQGVHSKAAAGRSSAGNGTPATPIRLAPPVAPHEYNGANAAVASDRGGKHWSLQAGAWPPSPTSSSICISISAGIGSSVESADFCSPGSSNPSGACASPERIAMSSTCRLACVKGDTPIAG